MIYTQKFKVLYLFKEFYIIFNQKAENIVFSALNYSSKPIT